MNEETNKRIISLISHEFYIADKIKKELGSLSKNLSKTKKKNVNLAILYIQNNHLIEAMKSIMNEINCACEQHIDESALSSIVQDRISEIIAYNLDNNMSESERNRIKKAINTIEQLKIY